MATPDSSRQLTGVTAAQLSPTDVRFVNERDQIMLAGQLFLPPTPGPHPAAAIINGSGASHRTNSWYLTLTDHLVDSGYAVLWPDKRGSGASEGRWETASFEALARDATASLDFLRSHPKIDPDRIGVIGMSQGGRIAAIVAADNDDIAYGVSFSGGVLPAYRSLRYEETHNLREIGFLPGVSELIAPVSSWAIINVAQTEFWDAVGNFDPLPYWAKVDIPVLFQFGTDDTNVDTATSAARLTSLQQSNIHIQTYRGSGHAIEQPPDQGDEIIRPEALNDLTRFIDQATRSLSS
ncbi:MAG: alpha/beta fold hydrolase [Nitriliruptorales bacterium]|nr:alpha/beta fold hydrolase [Nitriliruptorales bacterium]